MNNVAPTITSQSPASQTIDEGQSATFDISWSDPGADTFTVFWDFDGDGSFDTSTFTSSSTSTTISSVYNEVGTYIVGVMV